MPKSKYNRPIREIYIYANYHWKILSFKKGTNFNILDSAFDQLLISLTHYSKMLVVRFDIHLNNHSTSNKEIAKLFDTIKLKLIKAYSTKIGYCWVREISPINDTTHYHCIVSYNGHKARSSHVLFEIIKSHCQNKPLTHRMPDNATYHVSRGDLQSIQRVLIRLSYLAKNESKESASSGVRRYATSNLSCKSGISPFQVNPIKTANKTAKTTSKKEKIRNCESVKSQFSHCRVV